MITADGLKLCPRCQEWKLASGNFPKSKRRPDGYDPYCKACHAKKAKDRFERDPERVRALGRASMARQRVASPERTAAEAAKANAAAATKRKAARIERMGDIDAGVRRCADCKQIKPLDQFAKDKRKAGGVGSYCLECNRIRCADRAARHKARNPNAEKAKRDRFRSSGKFAVWEADYRQRPHVKAVRKLRDKVRPHAKRGQGAISRRTWQALLDAFGGVCCYCDAPGDMTVEHLTPLAKGGTNEIGNVAPACVKCNASKRARTAEEFAPDRAPEIRRKARLECEALAA
jgi:5-methylcytosine-specific restriction endonuclease McrA